MDITPLLALKTKIAEEIKQHSQQMAVLKAQLQGVERSIAAMGGEPVAVIGAQVNGHAPEAPKIKRGNIKDFVPKLLAEQPPPGLKIKGILLAARQQNNPLKEVSLKSFLRQQVRDNKLTLTDGHYRVARQPVAAQQ